MVIPLMTVGTALIVLLALVVTVVDVAWAPARRALAAERRRAWERAVAGTHPRAATPSWSATGAAPPDQPQSRSGAISASTSRACARPRLADRQSSGPPDRAAIGPSAQDRSGTGSPASAGTASAESCAR